MPNNQQKKIVINFFPYKIITIPLWVAGIVLAKGFWSTFFAVVIPFWAWYLSVEKVLQYFGVI